MEAVLDPRGKQERPILKLAPRVTMDALRRGSILFFDNTKLSFCNYMEVFRRIKENLAKEGITNFIDFCETVRGKSTRNLKKYAAPLAKSRPVASVIALCDMGTSPATTILTISLEEQGIPSVYITAPPGHDWPRPSPSIGLDSYASAPWTSTRAAPSRRSRRRSTSKCPVSSNL